MPRTVNAVEAKKLKELSVFREFAEARPLAIAAGSASSRDEPEPDILCHLESGEMLAFELVEVADTTSTQLDGFAASTKLDQDSMKLEAALNAAYGEAMATGAIDRPGRFTCHVVTVHFRDSLTLRRRKTAARHAIELLNELGPGRHLLDDAEIRILHCQRSLDCSGAPPQFFAGSSYLHVGNGTVAGVKRKLEKKSYESGAHDSPTCLV